MSHTPPVDSKGAAIDKILGRFHDWEMYVHYPEEIEPAKGALKAAQAKKAILALLAQEVKRVRIEELKWAAKRPHGGQAGINELEERIKDLERLG